MSEINISAVRKNCITRALFSVCIQYLIFEFPPSKKESWKSKLKECCERGGARVRTGSGDNGSCEGGGARVRTGSGDNGSWEGGGAIVRTENGRW